MPTSKDFASFIFKQVKKKEIENRNKQQKQGIIFLQALQFFFLLNCASF